MSNRDKVLVTGASGFVGSAVAHQLIDAGFSVRALVRSKRQNPLALEVFELLFSIAPLASAANRGCASSWELSSGAENRSEATLFILFVVHSSQRL